MLPKLFSRYILLLPAGLISSGVLIGCGYIGSITGSSKAVKLDLKMSPISPPIDATVTNPPNFTWSAIDSSLLQSANSYEINVYNQANCTGSPISTTFSTTPSLALPTLPDGTHTSAGIIAHLKSGVVTTQSCSFTVVGSALISQTQFPGANYLALDVDFNQKLAYVASNYASHLFDVVDFTNEAAPVLFRSITPTSTPSTSISYSRGIMTYNNGTRLIATAEGSSAIQLFDLTSASRTGTWTSLGVLGSLQQVRKVAKIDTSNPSMTKVYLGLRYGMAIVDIAEPAGTMTIEQISNGTCSQCGNGAVMGEYMLEGSSNFNTNTFLAYSYLLSSVTTAPTSTALPDNGYGANIWSSAATTDGTKGFVGGIVGGFFSYDLSSPGTPPALTYRFTSTVATAPERDSVFVTEFGKTLLYNVRSDGYLDAWDVNDITHPVLIRSHSLVNAANSATLNQLYGVRVDPAHHRAYVVSTGGWFLVYDTRMLQAPTVMPITY